MFVEAVRLLKPCCVRNCCFVHRLPRCHKNKVGEGNSIYFNFVPLAFVDTLIGRFSKFNRLHHIFFTGNKGY